MIHPGRKRRLEENESLHDGNMRPHQELRTVTNDSSSFEPLPPVSESKPISSGEAGLNTVERHTSSLIRDGGLLLKEPDNGFSTDSFNEQSSLIDDIHTIGGVEANQRVLENLELIIRAIKSNDIELFNFCIDVKKVNVNSFNPTTLECPLSVAYEVGNDKIIEMLKSHGALEAIAMKLFVLKHKTELDEQKKRHEFELLKVLKELDEQKKQVQKMEEQLKRSEKEMMKVFKEEMNKRFDQSEDVIILKTEPKPPQPSISVVHTASQDLLNAFLAKDSDETFLMREVLIPIPKEQIAGYTHPMGCSFLSLPLEKYPSAEFPQLKQQPLFIRNFYPYFFEVVLKKCEGNRERFTGAVLTGNSGIGKSAFGIYALFRAVRAGRTVVYLEGEDMSNPHALVFEGEKDAQSNFGSRRVYASDYSTIVKTLDLGNNWEPLLIFDSCVPPRRLAPYCLIISSPKEKMWKECLKWLTYNTPLVFPNWTPDETALLTFISRREEIDNIKALADYVMSVSIKFPVCGGRPRHLSDPEGFFSNVTSSGSFKVLLENPDIFNNALDPKFLQEDFAHNALVLIPKFLVDKEEQILHLSFMDFAHNLDKMMNAWKKVHVTKDMVSYVNHPFTIASTGLVSTKIRKKLWELELTQRNFFQLLHNYYTHNIRGWAPSVGHMFEDSLLSMPEYFKDADIKFLGSYLSYRPILTTFPSVTICTEKTVEDFRKFCAKQKAETACLYRSPPKSAGHDYILFVHGKFFFIQCTISSKHTLILGKGTNALLSSYRTLVGTAGHDASGVESSIKGTRDGVFRYIWIVPGEKEFDPKWYDYTNSCKCLTIPENFEACGGKKEKNPGRVGHLNSFLACLPGKNVEFYILRAPPFKHGKWQREVIGS